MCTRLEAHAGAESAPEPRKSGNFIALPKLAAGAGCHNGAGLILGADGLLAHLQA